MDKANLKLVIALARAHKTVFGAVEKSLTSSGLTLSEFGVMELLHHRGPQPVQIIAEKILVTSGTITYIIDKLEKKGWIQRRRCEVDRRVYYIDLTEGGKQLIQEVFPAHEVFLDQLFKDMGTGDKNELIRQLFLLSQLDEN